MAVPKRNRAFSRPGLVITISPTGIEIDAGIVAQYGQSDG